MRLLELIVVPVVAIVALIGGIWLLARGAENENRKFCVEMLARAQTQADTLVVIAGRNACLKWARRTKGDAP